MNKQELENLAATLRWLQREAALQWRDGLGDLPDDARIERRGSAIAFGQVARHLEIIAAGVK